MNQLRKNERGISLLALIITIIVMVILAGATISFVFMQDDMMTKVEDETKKYKDTNVEEGVDVLELEYKLAKNTQGQSLEDFLAERKTSGRIENYRATSTEGIYIVIINEKEFIMEDGKTPVEIVEGNTSDWTVSEDGTTLTGYTGTATNIVIPNYVNGVKITAIGDALFNGNTNITSLTISDGIETIGNGAFNNCTNLSGNLIIPDTVASIGSSTFNNCTNLSGNLIIPDSVTSIGSAAFSGCTGFTGNLKISSSVKNILSATFLRCSFTGDLVIPDSVTLIDSAAFNNCTGFDGNLILSNNLVTIGSSAFYGCSGFTGDLIIPNSVTTIYPSAFYNCTGFNGSLTLSNNMTTIQYSIFLGCSGFTGNLTVPSSVTTILGGAFQNCSGFTSITIMNPETDILIADTAFSGCTATPVYQS